MIWLVTMVVAVQAETEQDAQRKAATVLNCGPGILTANVISAMPVLEAEDSVPRHLSGLLPR